MRDELKRIARANWEGLHSLSPSQLQAIKTFLMALEDDAQRRTGASVMDLTNADPAVEYAKLQRLAGKADGIGAAWRSLEEATGEARKKGAGE